MLLSRIGAHDDRTVRASGDNGKPNAAARESAEVSKALRSERSIDFMSEDLLGAAEDLVEGDD